MNQNQCVPSWEVEDVTPLPQPGPPQPPPPPPSKAATSRSHSTSLSAGADISLLDYEVAELTWENGQLTMHGFGLPRVPSKSNLASGTLESIVNQATKMPTPTPPPPPQQAACPIDDDLVPWFDPPAASFSMAMDALVPNNGGVGSCSATTARVPVGSDWSLSASGSTRRDTCQQMSGGVNGMTSTSPETAKTVTVDDHDSVCHSRPQKERAEDEENEKKGICKSSVSTKRSRAAAIHNQSERKRRDKINQRMKILQKLVPNSSKTDKASMLDEVIDYLKQLQAQVQMMSRMSLPSMMMPMAIQQQLQMSMMSQMGMGMGMGMPGMGMGAMDHINMNNINAAMQRSNVAGISTALLNPSAFMPLVNWDGTSTAGAQGVSSHQPTMVPTDPLYAYLACQQAQPMTMDTFGKMAAMYHQLQRQQQQLSPNSNT